MRRAARVDSNHGEVMRAFRKMGLSVADTSRLGGGFPDIAIGWAGVTALVEIKDGLKVPSKRKLTPDEQDFASTWKGGVHLVESLDDVLIVAARLKRWHKALCADALKP